MSLIIFGDSFTFPEGNAATNRVHTYAKGFIENGTNVHVICFENEYIDKNDGIMCGIKYYHPFGQTERSKSFFIRRWLKLLKYLRAFVLIREINEKDKIIAINLWTQLFLTHLFAFVLAKCFKTKIIKESSEHPLRYYKSNIIKKIYGHFKLCLETKLSDGIFCITNYLIDFYKNRGYNQRKLFLVPSTVDSSRFDVYFKSPLSFEYILYCGNLSVLKDGVNILIESFTKISEKYPEINLVLIGKSYPLGDELILKDLVAKLNIEKRVFFLGQISRTDIPAYLNNAKMLTLARPQSIIADAGFPSKLTEYLATSKPVVVTKVGEIPVYLKDNESAFLSEPGSVDAFADRLDYVPSNYEFAQQVGAKGKELTTAVFNYKFQAKRMLDFIRSYN